jgi:hypothetical protein
MRRSLRACPKNNSSRQQGSVTLSRARAYAAGYFESSDFRRAICDVPGDFRLKRETALRPQRVCTMVPRSPGTDPLLPVELVVGFLRSC